MINIKLILAIVLSILATYAIYKIRKITNKFSFATLTINFRGSTWNYI